MLLALTHQSCAACLPALPPYAGARKVYAVEATDMAKFAKRLVAAQGLEGVVEVIQGVIESVDIPEKVDIIISEWMVSRGGFSGLCKGLAGLLAWGAAAHACVGPVGRPQWECSLLLLQHCLRPSTAADSFRTDTCSSRMLPSAATSCPTPASPLPPPPRPPPGLLPAAGEHAG